MKLKLNRDPVLLPMLWEALIFSRLNYGKWIHTLEEAYIRNVKIGLFMIPAPFIAYYIIRIVRTIKTKEGNEKYWLLFVCFTGLAVSVLLPFMYGTIR